MNKITRMIMLTGDKKREPEERRFRDDERYPDYDYPENRRRYNVNISNNRYYPRPTIYDDRDYGRYMPPRDMGGYDRHDRRENPIGFTDMHHDGGEGYHGKHKPKRHDEYGTIIEHKKGKDGKIDRKTAEEWTEEMKNEDGTRGEHWTYEQCEQAMRQRGVDCDPAEFYVTMNMMYSDYCGVAKMLNVNTVDFYVYMAKAFLDDDDTVDDKLMEYYEYIVK